MTNNSQHLLAIKRAALKQTEIDLNDPIKVGYKQMLVNLLCEKNAKSPVSHQASMDRQARNIISPKIPMGLKKQAHKHPQAFRMDSGFPFRFFDEEGKKMMVVVCPGIVSYFTPEEMSNIVIKAREGDERDRCFYERLERSAKRFIKYKNLLRARQIHYAMVLNLPDYNTYRGMLKNRPLFFEMIYKIRTGFDLLEKYK